MQYFANNITDYFNYREKHAAQMQKEVLDLFPGKFTVFRTLLKEV